MGKVLPGAGTQFLSEKLNWVQLTANNNRPDPPQCKPEVRFCCCSTNEPEKEHCTIKHRHIINSHGCWQVTIAVLKGWSIMCAERQAGKPCYAAYTVCHWWHHQNFLSRLLWHNARAGHRVPQQLSKRESNTRGQKPTHPADKLQQHRKRRGLGLDSNQKQEHVHSGKCAAAYQAAWHARGQPALLLHGAAGLAAAALPKRVTVQKQAMLMRSMELMR